MEAWQKIDELVELIGAQKIVDELKQWMSTDQLDEFANDIAAADDYTFSDEYPEEEEEE